jgi:hypothetical protein
MGSETESEDLIYRAEATTIEGFVQQLAVRYVNNGYRYYTSGLIREGKDPIEIDRKIITKYRIDIDKWKRHRRKLAGKANVQYIRFRQLFFILATGPYGEHPFFQGESVIHDAHDTPIVISGYSISYTQEGVRVRIDRAFLREIRSYFLEIATKRPVSDIVSQMRALPFEPYAPVRYQLFRILEEVNRKRKGTGMALVPEQAVRKLRRICRPFDPEDNELKKSLEVAA